MSIAVSAVVTPSRFLKMMTLVICSGSVAIGIAVGWAEASAPPARSDALVPAILRIIAALTCVFAGLQGGRRIFQCEAAFRIDISGIGQIRLVRLAVDGKGDCFRSGKIPCDASSGPLKLLPQSTLWSMLMVLRLQNEAGHIQTLLILPDTMPPTSIRMLSVACLWIAAHNIPAGSENA